ncbi:MAG: dihydroneopterin aldolase [Clostridiales bacterium]|nr:dihydroneopterin aldolase [Clostridiales bacterium]
MDCIQVRGLRVFAYHGVNPEEKEKGQPFELDLDLYADLSGACRTDDLAQTVNYAKVVKAVRAAMQEGPFNLIERAAQVTADRLLEQFPALCRVDVTLKKPRAPIAADFDYVAVKLCRTREDASNG